MDTRCLRKLKFHSRTLFRAIEKCSNERRCVGVQSPDIGDIYEVCVDAMYISTAADMHTNLIAETNYRKAANYG